MPKRILITGGYGNLGSWLMQHFCEANYNVSLLAKNKRNILYDLDFTFIPCDISNLADCKGKLQGKVFDCVIHAASVNDHFVENFAELAVKVNALGTRNLLESLKESNIKHFIYLSTFQVYGKYNGKIDENTIPAPINDYGATHLFAEYYVRQFHANFQLPYSIIRLTNSYGCPKDMASSKWYLILNDLAKTAVEEERIVLKSNGQAPRDFIWMGTVAKVFEGLVKKDQPGNTVYNLAGGKTYTMIDVAKFVREAFLQKYGRSIEIIINKNDTTTYPKDLIVSGEKLKKVIAIELEEKFEEEAQNIFEFVRSHQ